MSSTAEQQVPNFFGQALRRNALIILVLTVGLGLLAHTFASSRPVSYEGKVRVLLNPTPGNPYSPDAGGSGPQVTIAMTTEASIVDSAAVAKIANAKITPAWVPGSGTVSSSVPPNTQIVAITYRAATAAAAQANAQIVADAFLEYRKGQTAATQKTRLDILTKQAATVQAALTKASAAASGTAPSPVAVQQVQLLANQLATLQTSIGDLQATGTIPGSVVAAAALPTSPSSLDPRLITAGGGLAGLVLGLLFALLRQRADKRIRGEQLGRIGGVPILGGTDHTGVLAVVRGASSRQQDAVNRLLRTAILAGLPAPAALGVSPLSNRVPAGPLTLEVAQLIAEAGYRVVVIDASPSATITRQTGLAGHNGLAQLLRADPRVMGSSLQMVGNVSVVPTGGDLAPVQELLAGQRFAALVGAALADYDYVLVATGSASTPDAMGVDRVVGHLVLVGEDGRTTTRDVEEASLRARQAKVGILGLALVPRRGLFRRNPDSVKASAGGRGRGRGRGSVVAAPGTAEAPAALEAPEDPAAPLQAGRPESVPAPTAGAELPASSAAADAATADPGERAGTAVPEPS